MLRFLFSVFLFIIIISGCRSHVDEDESLAVSLLALASDPGVEQTEVQDDVATYIEADPSDETGSSEEMDPVTETGPLDEVDDIDGADISEVTVESGAESSDDMENQEELAEVEFDSKYNPNGPAIAIDEDRVFFTDVRGSATQVPTPENIASRTGPVDGSAISLMSTMPKDTLSYMVNIPLGSDTGTAGYVSIAVHFVPGGFPEEEGFIVLPVGHNSIVIDTTSVTSEAFSALNDFVQTSISPLSDDPYSYFATLSDSSLIIGIPFKLKGEGGLPVYGRVTGYIRLADMQTTRIGLEMASVLYRREFLVLHPMISFESGILNIKSEVRLAINETENCGNLRRLVGFLDLSIDHDYHYGDLSILYEGNGPYCYAQALPEDQWISIPINDTEIPLWKVEASEKVRIRMKPVVMITIADDQFFLEGHVFLKDTSTGRSSVAELSGSGGDPESMVDSILRLSYENEEFLSRLFGQERILFFKVGVAALVLTRNAIPLIMAIAASERSFQVHRGSTMEIRSALKLQNSTFWYETLLSPFGFRLDDPFTSAFGNTVNGAAMMSPFIAGTISEESDLYFKPTTEGFSFSKGVAVYYGTNGDPVLNDPQSVPQKRFSSWEYVPMIDSTVREFGFINEEGSPFVYDEFTNRVVAFEMPELKAYLLRFSVTQMDGTELIVTKPVSIEPPVDRLVAEFTVVDGSGNKSGSDWGILSITVESEEAKDISININTSPDTGTWQTTLPAEGFECDSEGVCRLDRKYRVVLEDAESKWRRFYSGSMVINVSYGSKTRTFYYSWSEWARKKWLHTYDF